VVSQFTKKFKNGVYDVPIKEKKEEIEKSGIKRDSKYRRMALSWIRYWSGFDWWMADTRSFWEKSVLDSYNDWMEVREDQWIVSLHETDERIDELLFIPWSCRRSPRYKKMLHRQMKSLFGRGKGLCIHLVLTTNPHKFRNVEDAMRGLKKSWRKLHEMFVQKKGRFPYVGTVEISPESHLPHLHILIFNVPWLDSVHHISDMWEKYGQGYMVHIRKMEYNRGLKEVLKYIYKQQKDDLLGAILWATRTRSFICSNKLLKNRVSKTNPETWIPSGYSYLGLVHSFYVERLLRHDGIHSEEFLKGDGEFLVKPPPNDWRSLLNLY